MRENALRNEKRTVSTLATAQVVGKSDSVRGGIHTFSIVTFVLEAYIHTFYDGRACPFSRHREAIALPYPDFLFRYAVVPRYHRL